MGDDRNISKQFEITEDQIEGKLPLLARLHILLTPFFISTLLNEIVKLSEILPQDNILQMRRNDGSKTTLVPIPEAKNKESFIKNENRKKWLQKYL